MLDRESTGIYFRTTSLNHLWRKILPHSTSKCFVALHIGRQLTRKYLAEVLLIPSNGKQELQILQNGSPVYVFYYASGRHPTGNDDGSRAMTH